VLGLTRTSASSRPPEPADLISGFQAPTPDPTLFSWGTPLPALPLPTTTSAGDEFAAAIAQADLGTLYDDEFGPVPNEGHLSVDGMSYAGSYGSGSLDNMLGFTPQSGINLDSGSVISGHHNSGKPPPTPFDTTAQGSVQQQHKRRHKEKDRRRQTNAGSLTHLGSSQGLMAACNTLLVTDSLLRIYHDVLENNLACWLAEHTCPYKPRQQRRQQPQLLLTNSPSPMDEASASSRREWGSVWSNQIYRRVKDLDRAARSSGLIHTTRTEDQAATKALNLAIMAFATQWAQGGRRRERFPQDEEHDDGFETDMRDEFEQQFQLQLWESAKRALDAVESVESFKVVYAELVFGLVQRPWLASRGAPEGFAAFESSGSIRDAIFMQIRDIINDDGPPVYLDRASRKIRTLRFRCEARAPTRSSVSSSTPSPKTSVVRPLSETQKVTVGLLYWLAVMFDTVSSSINQRPVVVADEDCQHESASSEASSSPEAYAYASPQPSHRWDLSLFSKDNPERPSTLRWPCGYDDAAEAVTRSAAVKVLLFRYISYLQNAMRKRDNARAVEDIITSVTRVHRYWNMTHGSLFRDLIKSYDSVPARIKSWFPCIHIPWLLGSLLVADLLDMVDENGLGTDEGASSRAAANLAARIRKSSATELADIARVTTPQDADDEEDQLPSYHFAVNEGTLLVEPWTVLLIRAFAKACIYHLSAAEDLRSCEWEMLGQTESEEYRACLGMSDACVKALWFLGRKSEMARRLSLVFAGAVRRLQTREVKMGYDFWSGSPV
jgi:hypothetical protein